MGYVELKLVFGRSLQFIPQNIRDKNFINVLKICLKITNMFKNVKKSHGQSRFSHNIIMNSVCLQQSINKVC